MATTVPLSRVDHYVTAPCKLKNNHSHCIGEITSTTCTLDSSGLSVVGYNTKEESDPTTSFSEILSGEESKPRSQSQLTAIQSHRVREFTIFICTNIYVPHILWALTIVLRKSVNEFLFYLSSSGFRYFRQCYGEVEVLSMYNS